GVRRSDKFAVAPQPAPRDARGRRPPLAAALLQLRVTQLHVQPVAGDVDADAVARTQQGNRPAFGGLRTDVADARPGGATAEASIGNEGAAVTQAHALDGTGGGEHFLHAGATARALVANHHYVASLDLAVDDSLVSGLFRFKEQ